MPMPPRRPGAASRGGFVNSQTCNYCPRNANHTCKSCGRDVCNVHFKIESGLCSMCDAARARRETEKPEPAEGRPVTGQCAVCNKDAKKTCKSCGQNVCDAHFDLGMGICVMCANKKHREEMKAGGGGQ